MVTELLVPRRNIIVPRKPSYLALDMAFGTGAGATLFDKSRYRSHGTISGADWATGLHGYALDFVATSKDYVEITPTPTQLNFTSEAFSIIMRVNLDLLPAESALFARGLWQTDGYILEIKWDGKIFFRTYQLNAYQETLSSAGDIAIGSWYTVGISRSGAAVTIFKNGVDVTKTSATHINPTTSTRTVKLGIADDKSSIPFDGKMEFCRVFGGLALAASEHLAWHNALA